MWEVNLLEDLDKATFDLLKFLEENKYALSDMLPSDTGDVYYIMFSDGTDMISIENKKDDTIESRYALSSHSEIKKKQRVKYRKDKKFKNLIDTRLKIKIGKL